MPQDCPHDRCRFYLTSDVALCPACGRSTHLKRLNLVRFAPEVARHTLQARYDTAVADAAYWLTKWSELYNLTAGRDTLVQDQGLVLLEARDAAADAAEEAVTRRNALGHRYIDNGFERIELIRSSASEADWCAAVGIVERYLDTLWIDSALATEARTHLEWCEQVRHRGRVLQVTSTIRILEDTPICEADQHVIPEIDDELSRLRTERALLSDARAVWATVEP